MNCESATKFLVFSLISEGTVKAAVSSKDLRMESSQKTLYDDRHVQQHIETVRKWDQESTICE